MTDQYLNAAGEVVSRCQELALFTEEPGFLTRTFLSGAMHSACRTIRHWMEEAGMEFRVDAAGNVRGCYSGTRPGRRLIIGSHLDTVPRAGMFDGALGVILGIELVRLLAGRRLGFDLEVIGFSDEEGVRFGVPFLGSRALAGTLDSDLLERRDAQGVSIGEAIKEFGLNPADLKQAALKGDVAGYLEFHIEQGPELESLGLSLGIVEIIVGQSRLELQISGQANHAGTTPMHLRHDALAGAAEWITAVEAAGASVPRLVATVGRVEVTPGAGNVIPGLVTLSLDVRHPDDAVRLDVVERLQGLAADICARRGLASKWEVLLNQPAVALDRRMTDALSAAVGRCGIPIHQMNSGAGHDAMIVAPYLPAAMLFVRSPRGLSHHPDESVHTVDVAAALAAGMRFLVEMDETEALCE